MHRSLLSTHPLCSPKVHSVGCLLRQNAFPQYYHIMDGRYSNLKWYLSLIYTFFFTCHKSIQNSWMTPRKVSHYSLTSHDTNFFKINFQRPRLSVLPHPPPKKILFGLWNRDEWDGHGMQHVLGTGKVHTWFWWGKLRERCHLEDSGVDGTIILRWIFRKWVGGSQTGLIWLRIATDDRLLLMR